MTIPELEKLRDTYRDGLLNDTLPFWFPRSIDEEHGGYLLMRDRDGSLLDSDKSVWFLGRTAWLLATLYNTVEPRAEWLAWAKSGIDFMRKHAFDADGRMFFQLARDGAPLRKRRYFFSETFAVVALAAYAKASGEQQAADEARALFRKCRAFANGEVKLPAKFTDTRPMKGLGVPMIMLNTAQTLRDTIGDPLCETVISECIEEIRRDFVKPELQVVMEQVGLNGQIYDEHFDGRILNPGHAIEGAWFILQEAKRRGNDPQLIALGTQMLDWMWARGWDEEHGGILYFRDLHGKPVQEYWQDMKFWWPQNEAIIATLLAWSLTGDEKYAAMHRKIHDYAHTHFADREHGEWFGYLHRDGRISVPLKGNHFKGPYHLPRMQWFCWQLLEEKLR